jgi:H+/Cl- antiporter ClcA
MKYWLYLLAKLAVVASVALGLQALLVHFYPAPAKPLPKFGPALTPFLHDMAYTFLSFFIGLISVGLLYLAVWDQRRRCRSCLRRLIMPVATGSWGHIVLFGQPRTEWICPYGHGTLSIAELQITGREPADWQPHNDNIWKELESYHQTRK